MGRAIEVTILTRRDLLLAALMTEERGDERAAEITEKLIGRWTKNKMFGIVLRWKGWPVGFVVGYQQPGQRHQATIVQWAELPEIGHTNGLLAVMGTFLNSLPDTIRSAVMIAPDTNLDLHQNLKAVGFKAVKVLRNHFKQSQTDGYLFIKHLRDTEGDEEDECLI